MLVLLFHQFATIFNQINRMLIGNPQTKRMKVVWDWWIEFEENTKIPKDRGEKLFTGLLQTRYRRVYTKKDDASERGHIHSLMSNEGVEPPIVTVYLISYTILSSRAS